MRKNTNIEQLEDFASSAAPKTSVSEQIMSMIKSSIKSKGGDIKNFHKSLICSESDANKFFRDRTDLLTLDMVLLIIQNIYGKQSLLKEIKCEIGELLEPDLIGDLIDSNDEWGYLNQVIPLQRMVDLFEVQEVLLKKRSRSEIIKSVGNIIISRIKEQKKIEKAKI